MDHRNGTCSACGAEYKIPASFSHDVARCRECGGTVHIESLADMAKAAAAATAAAAAGAVAAAAKPQPTKPIAPKPAQAKPVAAKPVVKPAASPQARPAAPKPAAKPAATRPATAKAAPKPAQPAAPKAAPGASASTEKKKGGTLERLKRERAAQRATQAGQASTGGGPAAAGKRPATAARPAAAKASRPQAAGSGAKTKPAGAAAGRRSAPKAGAKTGARSGGGSRRRAPAKEKKAPIGALLGAVLVLGLGAGAFFFKDRLFGDSVAADDSSVAAATLDNGTEPLDPPADLATEGAGDDPATEAETGNNDAQGSQLDPASNPDGETAEGSEGDSGATPSAEGSEEDPFAAAEPPKKKLPNPDSVDLLALPDFGPAVNTSDAEWDSMQADIEQWMDPYAGAAGNRAKKRLIQAGYKAIPPILNRLKSMDLSTKVGQESGTQCQTGLREICNGLNYGWQDGTDAKSLVYNKKVVVAWATAWETAKDDVDKVIRMLKLEPESEAADAVRVAFGADPGSGSDSEEEPAPPAEEDEFELD